MHRKTVAVALVLSSVVVSACSKEATYSTAPDAVLSASASVSARDELNVRGVFNTQLRAENEVGFISTSIAKGSAQIKVADDNTITFKVVINNPGNEEFFLGHIHRGAANSSGGVVANFNVEQNFSLTERTSKQITLRGTATLLASVDAAVLAELLRDETDQYYVNLHTRANPGGAIRGQLR